jgi:hypothetical protein
MEGWGFEREEVSGRADSLGWGARRPARNGRLLSGADVRWRANDTHHTALVLVLLFRDECRFSDETRSSDRWRSRVVLSRSLWRDASICECGVWDPVTQPSAARGWCRARTRAAGSPVQGPRSLTPITGCLACALPRIRISDEVDPSARQKCGPKNAKGLGWLGASRMQGEALRCAHAGVLPLINLGHIRDFKLLQRY